MPKRQSARRGTAAWCAISTRRSMPAGIAAARSSANCPPSDQPSSDSASVSGASVSCTRQVCAAGVLASASQSLRPWPGRSMAMTRKLSRERAAQPVPDPQVQAPAVQQHEVAPPRPLHLGVERAHAGARRAQPLAAARASASASSSTCASVCAADSVTRSRALPAGTVGGRMATTQKPALSSARAARRAPRRARRTSSGWMGVSESGERHAARRRARRGSARCGASSASRRQASRLRERAAPRAWPPRPAAAARSCRYRCAPSASGTRSGRHRRRRRRRRSRRPCRACRPAPARPRALEAACSSVPRPLAPSTPRPCASSTTSQASCARARRAPARGSGARSPSMLNTPSVAMTRASRRILAEDARRRARVRVRVASRAARPRAARRR